MKMKRNALITCGAIWALSFGSLPASIAQETSQNKNDTKEKKEQKAYVAPTKVTDEQLRKHVTDINKATKFIGMKVKNLQNENLGEVQELVFDLESGRIAYAVLSVGGFLGANEKNIAVPITALTAAPGKEHLLLNADKERLQNTAGFTKDQWPSLDTPLWGAEAGVGTGAKSKDQKDRASQQSFTGTIVAIDPDAKTVTIKGPDGQREFALDSSPVITLRNKTDATLKDLNAGNVVTIEYEKTGDNRYVAKRIRSSGSRENN